MGMSGIFVTPFLGTVPCNTVRRRPVGVLFFGTCSFGTASVLQGLQQSRAVQQPNVREQIVHLVDDVVGQALADDGVQGIAGPGLGNAVIQVGIVQSLGGLLDAGLPGDQDLP